MMKPIFSGRRELLQVLGAGAISSMLPLVGGCDRKSIETGASPARKLRPVLDSDWWLIGAAPELDGLLPDPVEPPAAPGDPEEFMQRLLDAGMDPDYLAQLQTLFQRYANNRNEPVDHHIFRGPEGRWHLWGCVRRTKLGRVLYHWVADELQQSPWTATGEYLRCDQTAGECIDDFGGEEWIQSPYFVSTNDRYYMFYGGHSTGHDKAGNPVSGRNLDRSAFRAEGQICLMSSTDGREWRRIRNAEGYSRIFTGPGEARDPCVLRIGELWYLYYAGYDGNPFRNGGIYLRTSTDLRNWSDYRLVNRDEVWGGPTWTHECPHVVFRDGYYYLFRTENYYDAITHVYRSSDPTDFGIGVRDERYLGTIACAAPEIYEVDGREFLSSNHDPGLGTQLCRLRWDPV
jgi:hypothetical protein